MQILKRIIGAGAGMRRNLSTRLKDDDHKNAQEGRKHGGVRRRIGGSLAAMAAGFAVMVLAPSQAAAYSCGHMSTPRWYYNNYGAVSVANICSSPRAFKVEIAGGPDTACLSIGTYASRTYIYVAYMPWGYAYPKRVFAC